MKRRRAVGAGVVDPDHVAVARRAAAAPRARSGRSPSGRDRRPARGAPSRRRPVRGADRWPGRRCSRPCRGPPRARSGQRGACLAPSSGHSYWRARSTAAQSTIWGGQARASEAQRPPAQRARPQKNPANCAQIVVMTVISSLQLASGGSRNRCSDVVSGARASQPCNMGGGALRGCDRGNSCWPSR